MYCSRYLEGLVAKNLHCNADFLAVFGIFGFAQKLPTKQKLGPSSTFSASRLQREQLHSKPAESTCQLRFTSDRVDPVQHAQVMPTVLFRKAPLFSKVTPKSCLRGFPACHLNHLLTPSLLLSFPPSLLPSFSPSLLLLSSFFYRHCGHQWARAISQAIRSVCNLPGWGSLDVR